MPKKKFSAEQIVMLLCQIEVSMAQGKSPPAACREAGISTTSAACVQPVPATASPRCADEIISISRWYNKSVRSNF